MDGKAVSEVSVEGRQGTTLLDNGTPEVMMFDRDAASLGEGQEVGRGRAASGQPVVVMLHDAPALLVAGQRFDLPDRVMSGDLGLVEDGFGNGFPGFIGSPALEPFVTGLDHGRKVLIVMPADGRDIDPDHVRGGVVFSIWSGEQPTPAARIGDLAVLVDFDTGDAGRF